ncbi:MAG: acyltransferase family protein [Chthoniobacterales bacterium]
MSTPPAPPPPASTPTTKKSSYQPQLDGLRGVAILMVFFHHAAIHVPPWLDWGQMGVRLFFVLSGYLITLSLWSVRARQLETNQSIAASMGDFHRRRILRLAPAFLLALGIGYVVGIQDVVDYWVWHLTFISNFLTLKLGYWPGATAHFWSLAAQEQFYLVWPFVVFFLPRRYFPWALLVMVFVAWGFRLVTFQMGVSPFIRWVMLPASLDSFAIGGLLAWLKRSSGGLPTLPAGWRGAGLAILVLAIWFLNRWIRIYEPGYIFDSSVELLEAICAAYIVLGTMPGWKGLLGWTLKRPWLITLGRISYGVFVYHLFIMVLLRPGFEAAGYPPKDYSWLWASVTLTITVFISYFSYHFVEQPIAQNALAWYSWFVKKLFKPR